MGNVHQYFSHCVFQVSHLLHFSDLYQEIFTMQIYNVLLIYHILNNRYFLLHIASISIKIANKLQVVDKNGVHLKNKRTPE